MLRKFKLQRNIELWTNYIEIDDKKKHGFSMVMFLMLP
jgi:hypothetical protein